MKKILVLSVLALVAYLLLWPVPITPVAWNAPQDPGYPGVFERNNALADIERLDIDGLSGPEALAIGPDDGHIYSTTHEGWLIRFDSNTGVMERWVNTGGRPLGISFDQQGHLIVADAYRGLLSVAPDSTINVLTDTVNGEPIRYADDVDVAPDGRIWFSDASSKFGAEAYGGTYEASLLDLMEHGGHGRLLMYDPVSAETSVVLDGLNFANGVAVSPDGSYLLLAETGRYRVLKVWLRGGRAGQYDVLIDNLPGFPDNVERSPQGHYWVGLVSPRSPAIDALSAYPWLRKVAQRLPAALRPSAQFYGHVFAMDGEGEVLVSLQDPEGGYHTTTGAMEHDGWLWVSSLQESAFGRLRGDEHVPRTSTVSPPQ